MVPRDPAVRLGGARPPVRQAARRSSLRRPLIVALIAAFLFVWACGCAPPRGEGLHGRAAFDAWIADNGIREENGDLSSYPGQPCGGYRADLKLAVVDEACIAKATTDERFGEWIKYHELGHAVDRALDFPQGADAVGVERGAQCVAAVVLGYSLSAGDANSYWLCPVDQVERTRQLMRDIGAW